jgi:electron transport complex protein RnfD
MAKAVKAPLERVLLQKPQINMSVPTLVRMWLVSGGALLVIIQSSLGDAFASLFVAISALAAAVLTEYLFLYKSGRTAAIKDGSAVASALILALLLPNEISPLYAAVGAIFAMAVVKNGFGGLGSNWLNPALGGWLFVRFSWPASFEGALESSPLLLAFTPADTLFSGYLNLLSSPFPGIIADRGGWALLAAALLITVMRANRFWIPLVYLAVFSLLVRFAVAFPYEGQAWTGDIIFAIFTGGTLVVAFFLLCDPVSSAKSPAGMLLSAAATGALAFFFRYYAAEPYGAFFAVALVNALIPLLRMFERRKLYEGYS